MSSYTFKMTMSDNLGMAAFEIPLLHRNTRQPTNCTHYEFWYCSPYRLLLINLLYSIVTYMGQLTGTNSKTQQKTDPGMFGIMFWQRNRDCVCTMCFYRDVFTRLSPASINSLRFCCLRKIIQQLLEIDFSVPCYICRRDDTYRQLTNTRIISVIIII